MKTMGQGAHHLGTSPAPAPRNPLLGRRIGASSLPASPLVTTRVGTDVLAQGARQRVCAHEAAAPDRWQAAHITMATEGARLDAGAHGVPASGRAAVRRNAIAIAPGPDDAAAMHDLPQRDFRLNLRPGRARRLSKAGRHWAPITRQRATREERHSGRTWPTYCDKPRWAPPVMDGMGRTVAHGGRRRPAENEYLRLGFFERR